MSPCNNSDHCQQADSLNKANGSELFRKQFDGQITSIQQSNSNSFPSRAYIWAMGSWALQYQTQIPSHAVDTKSNQVVVGYPVTELVLLQHWAYLADIVVHMVQGWDGWCSHTDCCWQFPQQSAEHLQALRARQQGTSTQPSSSLISLCYDQGMRCPQK